MGLKKSPAALFSDNPPEGGGITAKLKQTLAPVKFLGRGGKSGYGAITKSALAAL